MKDREDNLCHAGFLSAARDLVNPVAERLKYLLKHGPCDSLLLTGHSAGGTIASLLYAHIMSTNVESALSSLESSFGSIHCITFGAPPVSRHPLPTSKNSSLFISIVAEGDPVPRADPKYLQKLALLLIRRKPKVPKSLRFSPKQSLNAGRLVVLRVPQVSSNINTVSEDVEAQEVDGNIFGQMVYADLSKHEMISYKELAEKYCHTARKQFRSTARRCVILDQDQVRKNEAGLDG